MFEQMQDAIGSLSGVESVGSASHTLLARGGRRDGGGGGLSSDEARNAVGSGGALRAE